MRYLTAALLLCAAAPALAEPSCEAATEAKTPVWQAIQSFEEEGGEVRSFKINSGNCYEIYGSLDGTNFEVFFDPATGEEVDRIAS